MPVLIQHNSRKSQNDTFIPCLTGQMFAVDVDT